MSLVARSLVGIVVKQLDRSSCYLLQGLSCCVRWSLEIPMIVRVYVSVQL